MKVLDCMMVLLGGATIGATTALLLAPCSGKEMRKKLCDMMKKKGSRCCKEELDRLVEKVESNETLA